MSIRVERPIGTIAHVILDNPARSNALTREMFERLAALWPMLGSDPSVRVVVLSGADTTSFCSGADLSAGLAEQPDIDDLIQRGLLKTGFLKKPVIAAITGHCVAGGLELALAADIRFAREDAKIGLPEVRWGIMPSGGAAMKLIDQIGHVHAMDLLLSGRLIDGREAERIGLVNRALPGEEVLPAALERAAEIAGNSPVAVAATKTAILADRSAGYGARETAERRLVAQVRASGHPRIGIDAFLARRMPLYDDPPD